MFIQQNFKNQILLIAGGFDDTRDFSKNCDLIAYAKAYFGIIRVTTISHLGFLCSCLNIGNLYNLPFIFELVHIPMLIGKFFTCNL